MIDNNEVIYDMEKYINFDKIRNIIEQNKDKELICFGGGTAADILMRKLLYQYSVSCFLDNNKKLWGQNIAGIPIENPDILKTKDKKKVIVLLLSRHVVDISTQLRGYGLEENMHFFNIYNEFRTYFRIAKFDETTKKYLAHLRTIPQDEFCNITYQSHPVIGVVCFASMSKVTVWYEIEQCLILRKKGYRAICIVDTLKGFDDYVFFDDYALVVRKYIQYILEQVKKICPEFEVLYIDQAKPEQLNDEDQHKLTYLAGEMVTWYDACKDETFLPNADNRLQVAQDILYRNFEYIKAFFKQYQFDTINIFTGIHKHRCLYSYISELYSIRMSSYDGDDYGGPVTYAASGVAAQSPDFPRMLMEKWLTKEELDILYWLAQKEFAKRINSTYKDIGYNYQLTGWEQPIKASYDIIMALNVTWDGAALGIDDLFTDVVTWILETVTYIMENTNATVMIREHPGQMQLKEYNHVDFSEQLHELDKYGKRVWICRASDKINSYQYIEQCKVVLPYSSTIGLESVALGKKIVVHTKCYYSVFEFANRCGSKEEYFSKIKSFYENDYEIADKEKREALLLMYMLLHRAYATIFTEAKEWYALSWERLLQQSGASVIVDVIAKNIPIIYYNMKKLCGANILKYLREQKGEHNNDINSIVYANDYQAGNDIQTYFNVYVRKDTYILDGKKVNMTSKQFMELRGQYIAEELIALHPRNVLNVGTSEATALCDIVLNMQKENTQFSGLELSLSKLLYAQKFAAYKKVDIDFVMGDMFSLPYPDNAFDVVLTVQWLAPNTGRCKEALKELLRVAGKYVVMLEPSYELGNEETRKWVKDSCYIDNLQETIKELGLNVVKNELSKIMADNNNTAITIIKKQQDEGSNSPLNRQRAASYACPDCRTELHQDEGAYFCPECFKLYPVIHNIPVLKAGHAILCSKYETEDFNEI